MVTDTSYYYLMGLKKELDDIIKAVKDMPRYHELYDGDGHSDGIRKFMIYELISYMDSRLKTKWPETFRPFAQLYITDAVESVCKIRKLYKGKE